MIFDIEINEPDQPSFKNTPKKLYSYIKSQKNENTGIAPLRSERSEERMFSIYRQYEFLISFWSLALVF
jgi:hypothetical protein